MISSRATDRGRGRFLRRGAARWRGRGGFTFLEVLVSLIILVSGVLAIANFFPVSLKASSRARLLSKAALLAQMKAEEIRRDADSAGATIDAIRLQADETTPQPFAEDPRMTYSFSGRSALDPVDDPDNPADDWLAPRVIVRENPAFSGKNGILFELRFDE
ncbi:MAG: hypothetical protein BWZ10_03261 [candidate division BRC1 bacterium ADurb.BinA364]|nr:MAG: hypothetical protein BWZ10_03261 [candidate division BRC1 bacterium ADurb.BinA364]